jgi:hypothetical protein
MVKSHKILNLLNGITHPFAMLYSKGRGAAAPGLHSLSTAKNNNAIRPPPLMTEGKCSIDPGRSCLCFCDLNQASKTHKN